MIISTTLPQHHSGKRLKSGYFCRIFDIFSYDNVTAHLICEKMSPRLQQTVFRKGVNSVTYDCNVVLF
jgi:hypothetical protein